ncbi:MAG: tRNA 2-thiouridine(34) synthase MnmA [Candidatus Pacebacteria bacterium]|nr:tRNA 2-thiouridine(34) synthase MnmA [Candidatus Paceibacterota bacterium]
MSKKLNLNKKTVFVGMSGGVDSSLSALLLKEQGYNVVGVFIKTWHPDFITCNEEEERLDAMRVAAFLDIPFLTLDLEDVYKKGVADYMISEYKLGRTPNPDVMCNREVKFGAFLNFALSKGADFVATGHYARNLGGSLYKGTDPSKDQSYFLWTLTKKQLQNILFPIGHLEKSKVRTLAKKHQLPVSTKKDSQGICFLGDIDIKDFLKHYIKEQKGKVVNEAGEEIGSHEGVLFYTLGERHGFVINKKTNNDSRYYIIKKDIPNNVLVVSNNKYVNPNKEIIINEINQIENFEENKVYEMQVRYHGELIQAKLSRENINEIKILPEKEVLVASGQSIVVYLRDKVILAGVVK